MKIKKTLSARVFDIFNVCLMLALSVIMIYPMWYVLVASFSKSDLLMQNSGFLYKPLGFQAGAYKMMMNNPMIVRGYLNTIIIVGAGTALNLLFTTVAAYVLSRRNAYWTKYMMMMIVFTMFFSGGLIPRYLTVTQTFGMYNSYFAIIIPMLINTYNLIIMKTAFMSIPVALEEAARIDGANHIVTLFRVILPVALPTVSVMVLYYAVAHWNAWFEASIYLKDRAKYPLQLVLREILISNDTDSMTQGGGADDQLAIAESVKYAVVVVATVPILCVYPFLQRYFVKGAMVGSVKE